MKYAENALHHAVQNMLPYAVHLNVAMRRRTM